LFEAHRRTPAHKNRSWGKGEERGGALYSINKIQELAKEVFCDLEEAATEKKRG